MLKSIFAFLVLLPVYVAAQYPAKPLHYVTDEANVLSIDQQQLLNSKLKGFERSSSNQVFVYITSSLNGSNLESLSQEIFHNWKIGSQNKDNGLLIAVFVNDHKFRIQTGYGLEGNLPDLLTKKIQDETMRPYFKENDFYTGLDKGIDELIYYSANAYKAEDPVLEKDYNLTGWLLGYLPNLFLLILFSYLLYRKKQYQNRKPGMKHFLFILALVMALLPCLGSIILFFMLMLVTNIKATSGRGYSSYGGDNSWSGGSGSDYSSGSGSDFSGGGGGDSGGGGSSSDW